MPNEKSLFKAMVADSCHDFDDFMPKIYKANTGFGVYVKLPKELYKKWVARAMGKQMFIEKIIARIRPVLEPLLLQRKDFLRVSWNDLGMYFQCYGSACEISPDRCGEMYSPHNVDNSFQAIILFTALSIYLPELYFLFKLFEENKLDLAEWPELPQSPFLKSITIEPARN